MIDYARTYEELSEKERKIYDFKKEINPNWTHEKILQSMYIDIKLNEMGPGQLESKDMLEIFKKTGDWTRRNFPEFWKKVEPAFNEISTKLSQMIKEGIKYVEDLVNKLLNLLN